MLFNSIEFLFFLPIVFFLYWFVFKSLRWQNLLVVVASYVFYGWWDWRFLLLIAFTTVCSFYSGLEIGKQKQRYERAKLIAALNIALNLSILGVFKYFNFFMENFEHLFWKLGYQLDSITLNIVLPVGISFYTFQALSYTIDVYRGKLEPTKNIVSFFAFISFFPQLVAGPIERATNLLPQFQRERRFNYANAVDGTKQILWGLLKKMVIADNCADLVNYIWQNYSEHNSYMLVLCALFFAFQIYGDFSGYSDIAIGTAKLFGIKLMKNFDFPYFSRNVAEFWKRWHISLNTWFVDYVYIPLGGSRKGTWQTLRNTMIIFLLSGIWHGANWTFIAWGAYHALLFVPLMLLGLQKKYNSKTIEAPLFVPIKEIISMMITFCLVTFGWIIFRANSIYEFCDYIKCMFVNFSLPETDQIPYKTIIFILSFLGLEWMNRDKEYGLQFNLPKRWMQWSVYLFMVLLILTQSGQQAQFIYFQF